MSSELPAGGEVYALVRATFLTSLLDLSEFSTFDIQDHRVLVIRHQSPWHLAATYVLSGLAPL